MLLSVPAHLRSAVKDIDENLVAIEEKVTGAENSVQVELWQYLYVQIKRKCKSMMSQQKAEAVANEQAGDAENDQGLTDEDMHKAKKRKIEYSPNWFRSYDHKLTVEQMRQILKDNRELLPEQERKGLSTDRKEALSEKIADLRAILKKQLEMTFQSGGESA